MLEGALRDDLDPKAPLQPVKLVITNWDAVMGADAKYQAADALIERA